MTLGMHAVAQNRVFWTPKDLGSAVLAGWYDANDTATITLSGSAVTQWDDKSGNGNHAVQATGASQPSYASNRVTFDGSSDFFNVTGISMSSTSRFVAAVAQVATGESDSQNIVGPSEWGGFAACLRHTDDKQGILHTEVSFFALGSVVTTAADHVFIWNLTSSPWRLSYNGTETTGSSARTFTAGRTMLIGKETNFGAARGLVNGSVRELLVASELSTANQQRVEGYLAWRWGLVSKLPTDHPYKAATP